MASLRQLQDKGDRDIVAEVGILFHQHSPTKSGPSWMRRKSNASPLQLAAHSLKSSSACIGAMRLAGLSTRPAPSVPSFSGPLTGRAFSIFASDNRESFLPEDGPALPAAGLWRSLWAPCLPFLSRTLCLPHLPHPEPLSPSIPSPGRSSVPFGLASGLNPGSDKWEEATGS